MKATTLARSTSFALALFAVALLLLAGAPRAEAAAAPTVSAVAPAIGPSAGGTAVTITGTGFAAGATVTFAGVAATGVTVVSSTSITATTPAGTPGAVTVTVRNADGQAANVGGGFTYQHPAPTVTTVAPATGTSAGGTAITVTGTGFRAGATVRVGGLALATSVVLVDANTITAVTPAGLVGANAVTITNTDAQTGTLAAGFTYTAAAAPAITSVAPTSGTVAGGTVITITGSGFVSGATVTVGGTAATSVTVVNATTITATTPATSTSGAATIAVTNPDSQSGSLASGYTYNPLAAPTVTAVSPATGPAAGGTSITVTGTGFVSGASVSIGGVAASSVVVVTSTSITAITPQRPAGVVPVTVTNSDGQSGSLLAAFTAAANTAPAVSSVSPNTGTTSGGTSISVTGTGFLPGAVVVIGGSPATGVTVINSTTITATTPAHAAGAVAVTVTNYDGLSGTNATGYTYKANAAPIVSAIAPATGPLGGGTSVTITGTNLQAGATVRVGTNYATDVTVAGTTAILATTPVGVAGVAPIVVTNPDGQSAVLSSGFTYTATPAPTITSISPDTGEVNTTVTITGTGFVSGATVMFGPFTASNPAITATSIIVMAPPTIGGAAPVIVKNPDGQVATLPDGFKYATSGTPNVAEEPPAGGMAFVVAGTTDLQALMAAQKFPVVAAFAFDVPTQVWRTYVVGAPANSLTSIKATDIVVLRR
ncbi:MAG: beta strand repeat-containing protein [Dehalococcoidia bacterium]